jgi:lysophospholipase L1-like esterase
MLECLVLGDSIATGIAQHRPECVQYAKVGVNSYHWVNQNITKPLAARTVVISLGSNDHVGVKTHRELRTLRELTKADRVYWILPANKPGLQSTITQIAQEYGDFILPFTPSRDGVHPTPQGYRELAKATH